MPFVLHIEALRRGPDACCSTMRRCGCSCGIIVVAVGSLFVWRVALERRADPRCGARGDLQRRPRSSRRPASPRRTYDQWGGFPSRAAAGVDAGRRLHRLDRRRHQDVPPVRPARARCARRRTGRSIRTERSSSPTTARRSPDAVRAGVTLYFFVYLSTFFSSRWRSPSAACRSRPASALRRRRWAASAPASAPSSAPAAPSRRCRTPAKWLLTIEMLAGRLEILVLVIPLTRTFWRT